jgi:L-threonylcarbamoyladenylate synthase
MVTLPFRAPRDVPGAVAATRVVLAEHLVVALPTETFYGLAVRPHDAAAVAALYELKGRGADKALPVAVASIAQLDELVLLGEPWRSRLAAAWPAPLTVVLPSRHPAAAWGDTVAVRVPAHDLLRRLLARVGPLTVTSANPAGAPPAATAGAVAVLSHGLGLLLDGGATPGGAASTLVDLTVTPPTVLRSGAWQPPPEWGVGAS